MKKILILILELVIPFSMFAFSPIDMVSFDSEKEFKIGSESQSMAVNRKVTPFAINKYETTYKLWYEVRTKAEKKGYVFQNPGQAGTYGRRAAKPTLETENQPVTNINWYDAIVWCNALSEQNKLNPCYKYNGVPVKDSSDTASCDLAVCDWTANGYRLPSEAEWELASRINKNTVLASDLISGQLSETGDEDYLLYSWSFENSTESRIVGTAGVPFDPNSIAEPATGNCNLSGIYDMCGNVLEFCWDWYGDYKEGEPYGPEIGYERVSRGGSYSEYTMFLNCGDRYSYDPNTAFNYFGFRLACTIQ